MAGQSFNAAGANQTTFQVSAPASTSRYDDGSTGMALPREHREELKLLDPTLSDQPDTIHARVFQPAAEASLLPPNLVVGSTELTIPTEITPAAGATEPRERTLLGSTPVTALAEAVCCGPLNIVQRRVKSVELAALELTSEMPMCTLGATEPTTCTNIPATGDREPRQGLPLGSTRASAFADTACVDPLNTSQWNIKPMELVPLAPPRELRPQLTHRRTPDIGTRISVTMPHEDNSSTKEYIGEYYGHGQSKTAFRLNGELGDSYHGMILKVAAKPDVEPHIFAEMMERSPCITSRIFYSSNGYTNNGKQYYCWITERTIPLDRLLKCSLDVVKQQCILGVILCLAQCAQNGLLLSDHNFFNLGVPVNREEQHRIVVIDAGSRGLKHPTRYSKKDCNDKVVQNVWKRAMEQGLDYDHVRTLWQSKTTLTEVVEVLHTEWMRYPYLVEDKRNTERIEQEMIGEVICERTRCTEIVSVSGATKNKPPEIYRINTPPPPEAGAWIEDSEPDRFNQAFAPPPPPEAGTGSEDSDPDCFGPAFIGHSGTWESTASASDLWIDGESNGDYLHRALMQQPVVHYLPVEVLFNDWPTEMPLISQQPVLRAYDLDGNGYGQEEFRAYYGDAFEERWAIASHVTQDITLLAEQLNRKQHSLTRRIAEHDSVEDALDVVMWMWKKDPVSPADDAEYPDDALSVLAKRCLKPLWWRADTLRKSGGDMTTTAPMSHAAAEKTWQKWRQHFCATELTPEQRRKSNKKQRSIFTFCVHKETGCVHLAQALMKFGARGTKKSDNITDIIIDMYRAKESAHHKEAVRQTHNTDQDEAIELARHQYKVATCKLRAAKRAKKKYSWTRSIHDRRLLEELETGKLYKEWYMAREKHHRVKPRSPRLMSMIAGMSDTHGEWSGCRVPDRGDTGGSF